MTQQNKPTIVVSGGDPAGIGPEVILKALHDPQLRDAAEWVVVAPVWALDAVQDVVQANTWRLVSDAQSAGVLVDPVPGDEMPLGSASSRSGAQALASLEQAVGWLQSDRASALVTAPVSKWACAQVHQDFVGHTEYLASVAGGDVAMMFVDGSFRVSLVTRHLPLSRVSAHLTAPRVCLAIERTLEALEHYWAIAQPRVAVCGVNPHAGEGGTLGNEEQQVIAPAIEIVRARWPRATVEGPVAADAVFYDAARGAYDAVVAMYHDQGLAPFKMRARDRGVNVTLGLPWVRTSPDHGTAFGIAGQGTADEGAMHAACALALEMCQQSVPISSRGAPGGC